jgi:prolipoprotein diacylglyceryltransferase
VGGGPLAASFPRGSVAFDELAGMSAIPPGWETTPGLHPTELYEAFGEFAIFAALLLVRPRLRRRPGALLVTYLGAYAVLRFVVEMFRGDVIRGLVVSLETPRLAGLLHLPPREPIFFSVGQLGSVILFTLCALIWKRLRQPGAPTPADDDVDPTRED